MNENKYFPGTPDVLETTPKLNGINNHFLRLMESVGQEFRQGTVGLA